MLKKGIFGPRPIEWAQKNHEKVRSGSVFAITGATGGALLISMSVDSPWTTNLIYVVLTCALIWAVVWIRLLREAGLYQRADKRFGTDLLGDPQSAPAIIEAKLRESADTVRDAYTWWLAGTWSQDSRDGAVANYDELAQLAWQIAEIPVVPWDKLSPPKKEGKVRSLPIAEAS